jgi:glycosyltransferase involved in cell wall biosynthesis
LFGGARQLGYLIDGLVRRGIENVLVCPAEQPLSQSTAAEVIHMPMHGDLDLGLVPRIGRVLRAVRPDLVHVHSRRGADSFVGIAARRAALPAVLTRRVDHDEFGPWARYKYARYARLIAISRAVQTRLCRSANVAAAAVEVIGSAVDSGLFAPDADARARLCADWALPATAVIAVCMGQFIARKNQRMLLEIWPALLGLQPALRLLLFGRGRLEGQLRRRIRAAGLQDYVKMCGQTELPEAILPGADLLLHPAQAEGLGTVVLEAMSAAVPPVASAAGGLVEIIDSGADGLLVPPAEPAAWIEAIAGLAADAERRQKLGIAARDKAVGRFTIEQMTDGYVEIYRREIDRRQSRRGDCDRGR